jgi:DNA-binding NarL/FixJ family response regulator
MYTPRDVTLTARELRVITLMANGRANSEIARELDVPLDTVKSTIVSVIRKLGARNRTDAAVMALRLGLIA